MHDDGTIHYPFSKYLTNEFNNPHTRELVSQSLRILYRFTSAKKIELAVRALEGRCLTYDECKKLAGLCYRPLAEIESLSDKKVVSIISAKAGERPEEQRDAVEPNTAMKRLYHIAEYLMFYGEVFLGPNVRSRAMKESLKTEYEKTSHQLKNEIGGTKQGHHHDIRSLPSDKFMEIIRWVVLRPEELFVNASGEPSRTLYRDRAMVLLACEGLRPGTLGNIARVDFRPDSRHLVIVDNRKKRPVTTSSTPVLKLGASTQVNSASETIIQLWPFTIEAIRQYIDTERTSALSKNLKNRSSGFLFLNEKGEPIKHRSTITAMFNHIGKRLAALGLLDVGSDPYFPNQKQYEFSGYVLRHSSATLYVKLKGTEDSVLDTMKSRFGWTMTSNQPQRYAARALSDQANLNLMEFNKSLMDEVSAKNGRR
ncbi:MAG: hypothetical protein WA056_02495 [Gallionella sp.]